MLVSEARPIDELDTAPRLRELGDRGRGRWARPGASRRARRSSSPARASHRTRRSSRGPRERGIPVWGELELGARLCERPVPRGHRDERQDDHDRDDRLVPARGGPRRDRVRQHRPSVPARGARGARGARRRGVLVPAAVRRDVPPAGLGPAEPRARSSRLARLVRGLRRGEGARSCASKATATCTSATATIRDAAAMSAPAPVPGRVVPAAPSPDDGEVGYVDGRARRRAIGASASASDRSTASAPAIAPMPPRPPRRRSRSGSRPTRSCAGLAGFTPRPSPRRGGRGRRRRPVRRQLQGDERACGARRDRRRPRRRADRRRPREGRGPVAARLARADRLAGVVAIGESAAEIASIFDGLVPVRVGGIDRGGDGAARSRSSPVRGTVLLAPACASWDMFRDYAERGDRFAAAARALMDGRWPVADRATAKRAAAAKRTDAPGAHREAPRSCARRRGVREGPRGRGTTAARDERDPAARPGRAAHRDRRRSRCFSASSVYAFTTYDNSFWFFERQGIYAASASARCWSTARHALRARGAGCRGPLLIAVGRPAARSRSIPRPARPPTGRPGGSTSARSRCSRRRSRSSRSSRSRRRCSTQKEGKLDNCDAPRPAARCPSC